MGYIELDNNIDRKGLAIQEAAREFGMEVMRPAGIELDKLADPADVIAEGSVLWDVIKKSREEGFHKGLMPKAFGGDMGKSPITEMSLMCEQMGYADAGLAVSLAVSGMPFAFAAISPYAEVRNLPREYCEDKEANLVGCWALTEPNHGSDWIMALSKKEGKTEVKPGVRAVKKGDEYILNGEKAAWVSNGTIATHATLHVGLDPSLGMLGSGIAVCPLDLPGISRGKPLNKIGQRPLNQGELFFEDVKLHKKYMVIPVPGFFGPTAFGKTFLGTANNQMGAMFSGLARAAYDEALKYAKETEVNGSSLFERQAIRLKLFNMFTMVESSSIFARKVAENHGGNNPGPIMRAFSSSAATYWVIGKVIQLFFKLYEKYKDRPFAQKLAESEDPSPLVEWGKYGIASKILATETSLKVTSEAMQIVGPKALSTEYPLEKMFRDARASMIEDGVNETLALEASENL